MKREATRKKAVVATVLLVVCSLSVRSEPVEEELQELRVTVQALKQQNANLERRLQEALMKVEVLNLKRETHGNPFPQKGTPGLRQLPDSVEELRWQSLTTVRLLRRSELSREEMEQRLRKVALLASEAMKSADKVDPKKRAMLEEELRAVKSLLGPIRRMSAETELQEGEYDPAGLKAAKVIEFRQDLSLAVINVGRREGIRLGMPFDLVRNDQLIATAVVVEVRDELCGALIERMDGKNPVQAEDRAVLRKS